MKLCPLFFSTILGAAKLTGKTKNGLSVGFINAVTNDEFAEIDTIGVKFKRMVEPLTNYFIGRVQKAFWLEIKKENARFVLLWQNRLDIYRQILFAKV